MGDISLRYFDPQHVHGSCSDCYRRLIVQKMLESNGTNRLSMSRDDGIHIARRLDNRPFKDCMDIFHMIYRSGESRTGTSKGEFNPIRDGIGLDKVQGIDEDTVQLVNEIRRIMDKYRTYIARG